MFFLPTKFTVVVTTGTQREVLEESTYWKTIDSVLTELVETLSTFYL